ncbi:flagellar basal body-associated protein FliL [Psychrosphaera ytuae]|uniref:Flagellar protein FliL n=1 Tax=Psychrosphaera ytuae TaxID=2820710 RepID=A0A975DB94_9GAMM|nr:flagellar basal body-associated protein FliL [Psychrosphaera ytuae]QTH63769.1 flagellar basal body-associated protein FliL [Psychrosphaera ytuae]
MAEENDELTLEEEGGKGGNKMLIIIIAAVVVIVGGAAAFFLLSGGDETDPEAAQTTEAEGGSAEAAQDSGPVDVGTAKYVTMPRPFTFNVPGTSRDRLVQIKVQLMVRGDNNEELAQKHIPLIEGSLLKAFSTANADALATAAGKDALKLKAAQEVQKAVIDVTGSKIVEEVLFTGFVMQ